MKVRYLRSVADLENYRKRIGREKQDIIRSAAAGVIEELLPVLDNMKLGLQAAENHPEAKDVTIGFKMVEDQLKKTLSEHGLVELIPDGEVFDPNLHEAMMRQSNPDKDDDTVLEVYQAGYLMGEQVLRPSKVIVNKIEEEKPAEEANEETPDTAQENTETEQEF